MCGGSPAQSLVCFSFPFFPHWQFGCFFLEKLTATILHGFFQVNAIPASVVEAQLLVETSYNDEKMLHVVHESFGMFKAHPTFIGISLVIKCSWYSNNKVCRLQF